MSETNKENSISIEAATRKDTGKGVARKLRRQGKIPAILAAKGKETLIELDPKLLPKAWRHNDKKFDLVLDGKTLPVRIQELQLDPVKRHALHVDLTLV